jgi:hypothetical protein
MSVTGRVNVGVVFHDTDGDSAIKVVSLDDARAYTTGKVASVSGTCGTAAVSIVLNDLGYRDAAGDLVTLTDVTDVFFTASADAVLTATGSSASIWATGNQVSASALPVAPTGLTVASASGTASYTVVLHGT